MKACPVHTRYDGLEVRRLGPCDPSCGRPMAQCEDARGPKVDFHCPYDEATLRLTRDGQRHICPCCWSTFLIADTLKESGRG